MLGLTHSDSIHVRPRVRLQNHQEVMQDVEISAGHGVVSLQPDEVGGVHGMLSSLGPLNFRMFRVGGVQVGQIQVKGDRFFVIRSEDGECILEPRQRAAVLSRLSQIELGLGENIWGGEDALAQ